MAGWEPDFRGEKEYGKEHAIWLELLKDRRRVRIPLPAEGSKRRVQSLWEILGAFSRNGEGVYEAESMGMGMEQA